MKHLYIRTKIQYNLHNPLIDSTKWNLECKLGRNFAHCKFNYVNDELFFSYNQIYQPLVSGLLIKCNNENEIY